MIEQFMADGITHMFGNPGTVEQGFLDALSDYPDVEYILALQEAVVVGIADGYARATRKPTIVQLHSGVGLGNGIGMMYQAKRGHAPLVVIARSTPSAASCRMGQTLVPFPWLRRVGRITTARPTAVMRQPTQALLARLQLQPAGLAQHR